MSHLPVVPESLYEMKFVEDPRISPDGSTVAFIVAQADPDRNVYDRRIWMVPTDGSDPPRAFSSGGAQDYAPRWSPDGRTLAFISTRAGSPQLYTIPVDGGEPTQLTDRVDGVRYPRWSPGGNQIAFISSATAEDRALEDRGVIERFGNREVTKAWQEEIRERKKDPRVIERLPYRTGQEFFDDRYRHVYVVPSSGGEPRRLTDGDYHHSEPDWTPDGRSIVANSKREQSSGEELFELWSTILRYDVESGAQDVVIPEVSEESRPVRVSPDGRWVAHILVHKVESPYQYPYELAVSPMEGGTPRIVSADACLTVAGFEWDADSEHLIVSIHAEGDSKLARLSREGGDPQILVEGGRWVQDFDVSSDGRVSACVITDPSSPGELFLVDLESGATKRLSNFNQDWVESHALSRPHEMWYEGAGGTDIQGWYMYPKDFDSASSYPVVVEIHGGPQIMWGNTFWHEFQVLASRGYFVFFCNPRGSSGYGLDFQLMRDKGGYTDVPDILAGVDALLERETAADEERLVVTGGSYGGFLTGWTVGHTDRFKAAVAQRGVYDQFNMFGSSDIPECVEWYHNGLPREENLLELWEYSPAAYADRVTTPTMLLHSDLDYRVPVSQAEMFFTALRRHANRDAVMVRYPREGHELSRSGEPRHRIDRLRRIVEWFDRNVQPEARGSRLLNDAEIDAVMAALLEWSLEGNQLVRVVECGQFEVALNLTNRIADVASETEQYPGISVDGGVLSLRLGVEGRGLTDRDYVLARMLNLRVFGG